MKKTVLVMAGLMAMTAFGGPMAEKIAATCEVKAKDAWFGYDRTVFVFDGEEAWVIEPKAEAAGRPWCWTMEWAGAFAKRAASVALLAKGYHHVTLRPGEYKDGKFVYKPGNMTDARVKRSRAFQRFLVDTLGFASKANLIGMSWGGFYSVRYAAANPDAVGRIYLDAPLLDFSSLAGWNLKNVYGTYGITDEKYDGANDPRQPVNMAAPIAKAGIPVLLLYGGKDGVVPPAKNGELFAKRFREAGGKITVERRGEYGHHPHGLEVDEQQRFADFFAAESAAAPATVTVDWTQTCGPVKPVNGVGQPPMIGGPANFKMFEYLKDAGIPYSRLHDVDGKFAANLYVDVPNVFRNFDADENDPKNYDFAFTDTLLRQLAENGVEPWFRLGVTIENYPQFNRYRIFPPKDFAKWARICEHIVRHCTEGWANGLRLKITYWEIWNEADLNPDKEKSMTWAGTFDEYCEFYAVVARHLKEKFPHLKIGGPASCGLYAAENPMARGQVRYHVDCCVKFLDYVKEHDLPMDFFSFHSYSTAKPAMQQIASARKLLVDRGLGDRETWLNEWLCNAKHEHLGTALQASGVAAELIGMQNSELTGACIYDARCGVGAYSPLFNPMTYEPHKAYYAFTAFNELRRRQTAVKVKVEGASDLWACAAANGKSGALMLANASATEVPFVCAFGAAKVRSCRITDAERTNAAVALPRALPPYSFVVAVLDRQ